MASEVNPLILVENYIEFTYSYPELTLTKRQANKRAKDSSPAVANQTSKLDGDGKHVARLAFAGGAFTPPLTKGRYAPLETQLIRTDSSPPQADGAFSGSS